LLYKGPALDDQRQQPGLWTFLLALKLASWFRLSKEPSPPRKVCLDNVIDGFHQQH
jgi:hypothetical protein